ncbi:MAG: hypothetical protein ABSG91_25585 [Syntrophobacteraceae bacterium]|jgi:hypothetical protein
MAVEFDLSTAGIDVVKAGATTQVTFFTSNAAGNPKFALFDMVKGHSLFPAQLTFAFTLGGHVKLKAGFNLNELLKWKFGFIQMMAHKQLQLIYLGRTQAEGHIAVDMGRVIGTSFLLDKFKNAPAPFFMPPSGNELDGEVTFTMGDHPLLSVQQQLRNTKTGHLNTLFRLDDERHAISTFVGQDPTGKIVHFAHVEWFLSYDSDFQIVGGELKVKGHRGGLRFKPVQLGAHPSVPAKPLPPIANEVAGKALKEAFIPGSVFRFDGLFYPPSAPENFIFDLNPKPK